jgi:putative membrane protein
MRRLTQLIPILMLAAAVIACESPRDDTTRDTGQAPAGGAAGTAGRQGEAAAGADRTVQDLAAGGVAEVELGELAQQKAVSPEVKQFAQMMVRDHTKANSELKQIAGQENIQLSAELDDKHRDVRERLSKLSGREFDREYMKAMVEDHEEAIDKLESLADDDDKPRLKQFASNTLQTVRQHQERAKSIQEQLDRQGDAPRRNP